MCEALRELMKDEIEAKKRDSILVLIKNLMKNTGVSAEKAMENLGISIADRNKYLAKL